jgi:hypothetical protein
MENGAIKGILGRDESEIHVARNLIVLDQRIGAIREELRAGRIISSEFALLNLA